MSASQPDEKVTIATSRNSKRFRADVLLIAGVMIIIVFAASLALAMGQHSSQADSEDSFLEVVAMTTVTIVQGTDAHDLQNMSLEELETMRTDMQREALIVTEQDRARWNSSRAKIAAAIAAKAKE